MAELLVERDGGVVTVTLNRPEVKNALTTSMFRELGDLFRDIARRTEDRVVVLTGAGGGFCSGADLGDPTALETHHLVRMRLIDSTAITLHRTARPTWSTPGPRR